MLLCVGSGAESDSRIDRRIYDQRSFVVMRSPISCYSLLIVQADLLCRAVLLGVVPDEKYPFCTGRLNSVCGKVDYSEYPFTMLGLSHVPSSFHSFSASSAASNSSTSSGSPHDAKPMTSFACKPKPRMRRIRLGQRRHQVQPTPLISITRRDSLASTDSTISSCGTPPVIIELEETEKEGRSMYRSANSEDVLVVPKRCYQHDTPLHRATQPKVCPYQRCVIQLHKFCTICC